MNFTALNLTQDSRSGNLTKWTCGKICFVCVFSGGGQVPTSPTFPPLFHLFWNANEILARRHYHCESGLQSGNNSSWSILELVWMFNWVAFSIFIF